MMSLFLLFLPLRHLYWRIKPIRARLDPYTNLEHQTHQDARRFGCRGDRRNWWVQRHPLPSLLLLRSGQGISESNGVRIGARVAPVRRNGGITHSGLVAIRANARELRCHRIELAWVGVFNFSILSAMITHYGGISTSFIGITSSWLALLLLIVFSPVLDLP